MNSLLRVVYVRFAADAITGLPTHSSSTSCGPGLLRAVGTYDRTGPRTSTGAHFRAVGCGGVKCSRTRTGCISVAPSYYSYSFPSVKCSSIHSCAASHTAVSNRRQTQVNCVLSYAEVCPPPKRHVVVPSSSQPYVLCWSAWVPTALVAVAEETSLLFDSNVQKSKKKKKLKQTQLTSKDMSLDFSTAPRLNGR